MFDEEITEADMAAIAAPLRGQPNAKALGMLGVMTASYLATAKSIAARNDAMEMFIDALRETVNNMELQREHH